MELNLIETSSEYFLCDRYEVVNCERFNQLLDAIKQLESENVGYKFLVTLDDLGQACYTSMHSKMSHDLDCTNEMSLAHLPPECFEEDGAHKGYLGCKEEFNIRKRNIEQKLSEFKYEDICKKEISLYSEYEKDFYEANNDPTSFLDSRIYILKVPVELNFQALYAFPNGYFQGDLNPFENIVFARTLYEKFGYELIGIGATYIAFRKSNYLNDYQVQDMIELLNHVYADEFETELRRSLVRFINDNDFLILSYTE